MGLPRCTIGCPICRKVGHRISQGFCTAPSALLSALLDVMTASPLQPCAAAAPSSGLTTLCFVLTNVHACCSARDAGVDAQRLEAMAPDAKRPKTGTEDTGGKKET